MSETEVLNERRKKLVRLRVCSRSAAISLRCITRRSKTIGCVLIDQTSNIDLIRKMYKISIFIQYFRTIHDD
jgi:hypothetical protein